MEHYIIDIYMAYIHNKIFNVHIDTADNTTNWLLWHGSVEKKNSAEKKFLIAYLYIYCVCACAYTCV